MTAIVGTCGRGGAVGAGAGVTLATRGLAGACDACAAARSFSGSTCEARGAGAAGLAAAGAAIVFEPALAPASAGLAPEPMMSFSEAVGGFAAAVAPASAGGVGTAGTAGAAATAGAGG